MIKCNHHHFFKCALTLAPNVGFASVGDAGVVELDPTSSTSPVAPFSLVVDMLIDAGGLR